MPADRDQQGGNGEREHAACIVRRRYRPSRARGVSISGRCASAQPVVSGAGWRERRYAEDHEHTHSGENIQETR